jgi:hypothetical protein
MAVIWGNEGTRQESGKPVGEPCFFCGKAADSPMVFWMGLTEPMYLVLHPACCLDLSLRLFRDVHEIQQTLEGHIEVVTDPRLNPSRSAE